MSAAKKVAQQFDELYESPPLEYRDLSTTELFDDIFGQCLDLYLLDKYTINAELPLPESMIAIKEAMGTPPPEAGFTLDGVVRILFSTGNEELKAYRLVWAALKAGHFIRIKTSQEIKPESVISDSKIEPEEF